MTLPRRSVAVLALVVLIVSGRGASVAGPATPLGPQPLEVAVTPSGVSLTARQTPLAQVLTAVGQQAGVKIILRGEFTTPVTETLVNVPVDAAIQRLTRWHSIVLIYGSAASGPAGTGLSEVWVTSGPADRGRQPAVTHLDPAPGPGDSARSVSLPSESRIPRREPVVGGSVRPVAQARNPGLATALRGETPEGEPSVADTLVRERGVQGAVLVLREAATREPDPGVRRRAIRSLASLDGPDVVEAIRATLNDDHPGVRSEAQAALRRLARSRTQ
jgi:HEAT repeat protein